MGRPMTASNNRTSGFTLIELMIVIAIVGILVAVAVPQYSTYTKRVKYAEIVNIAGAMKTHVYSCAQNLNTVIGCNAGTNMIPPLTMYPSGYIQSMTIADGVITTTANGEIDSTTLVLSPTYIPAQNRITWAKSGTCITASYC